MWAGAHKAPLIRTTCSLRCKRPLALPHRARATGGRKVLSLRYAASRAAPMTPALCANAHGFSLHAGVRCGAHQRKELECLCHYITRPAIANEWPQCRSVTGSFGSIGFLANMPLSTRSG
jgi:hypothetical protein